MRLPSTSPLPAPRQPTRIVKGLEYPDATAVGSAADPALGGNALQAVVAVDATATASAAGTLPASDTFPTERGTSPAGITPAAFALIVIALATFAIASIATSRRLRQD